ncbi:ig domain protein group 2 domain protein [Firmicutes bacterium CAG:308]|nr:ig domain protein group 2 domain protein [Firmicutes bacterium CAG:308]
MKTSKYSKVVCAGLIAVSTVVPNMQQRINAYEVDETDIVSEEAQFASKESSVSEVVPTTDATQETENVTVQQNDEVVYPTGITIDNTLLNLGIGDEKDIRVVSWSGAQNWDKNTGISWSSSNPEIVSVNANGKIVALRNGEAIITATVVGNPSVSASCMVYVSDEAAEETYPTRLTLASTKKLDEGESEKLSVGYGGSPTNKELIWTTSDENVAKVSEDGTVTATGAGTAIVTATSVGKNNGQEEPASASCTVTVTGLYEGFKYNVENNEITITGYSGSETSIQIPATIHGKQVTKIQDNAFTSKKFASVVIPEGVTTLGKNAFRANRSLTQLTLPSTISVIGQGAFSMCESLVDVVIPEGVTQISTDAFNDCESLVNVTLPKSLKTIGSNAFADCTSLTTIKLPDNLQSITSTSFEKTVTIQVNEGSATADLLDERNISYQIINSEIYPTTIGLNEDEKTLTQGETFQLRLNSYSGNPTNKDLIWSTDNETVATVDENGLVTAVGEGTAVITGTSVGVAPGATEPAFDTCTIHVEGVEGDYVYTVTDGNVTIEDYLGTDTEIVIPSTIAGKPVTEIGPMSFWMDDNMTSVVIPEGVTTIGKQAFNGNDNLANIKLPSTLKTIGERAFWGTAITELNVPEGVTSIGREAFNSCKELSSVTLPESLTYIGPNAFNSCPSLNEIRLPSNIISLGTNALRGFDKIYVKEGSTTETALKNGGYTYSYYTDVTPITNTVPSIIAEDVILTVGDQFDPMKNVQASDNEDGDLTDQIKVLENTVNVEKPGIYSLIYYVEDVQGASCTKTIKVTVNAKEESKPSSDQNGNKKEESKKSTTDTKKTKGTNTGVGLEIGLFSSLIGSSVIGAGILSMLKKKK